MEAILSAKGLSKTYGTGERRFEALRGVDLDIAPGESVAIVGRSGSGKSTLMHLLALLDRPDDGEMLIDGRPASHLGRRELDNLRNERFGFVFQQFFLIPNLTVLENVTLPLAIRGVSRKERARRGMEVLERLDLADKAKNAATALSGGQKQRVVIARALVGDPSVIFADERPATSTAPPAPTWRICCCRRGRRTGSPSCSSPTTMTWRRDATGG